MPTHLPASVTHTHISHPSPLFSPQDEQANVAELEAAAADLQARLTAANESAERQGAAYERLGRETMGLKEALQQMKLRSAEMAVKAQVCRKEWGGRAGAGGRQLAQRGAKGTTGVPAGPDQSSWRCPISSESKLLARVRISL